jgi:hypothetical protein
MVANRELKNLTWLKPWHDDSFVTLLRANCVKSVRRFFRCKHVRYDPLYIYFSAIQVIGRTREAPHLRKGINGY